MAPAAAVRVMDRLSPWTDGLCFLLRKSRIELANRVMARNGYVEHYGIHHPRNNAGDAVLFQVIEDLFDYAYGRRSWRRTSLRQEVSQDDLRRLNARAEAALVGGGGLLMNEEFPFDGSGWQWRITRERLAQLRVPLVVFAIGYNQFRDATEFPAVFDQHLRDTVAKSCFFGVRNNGSVERVRSRLPAALHARVVYQPCMTTVLRHFHPSPTLREPRTFSRRLALNLAFDRIESRYGRDRDAIVARIVSIVDWAVGAGWDVTLVVQAWEDEPAVQAIPKHAGRVRVLRLSLATPEKVIRFYAMMPVTIGMRGHAQMIPFGCGNAIFSLVSHDKMRFFLEDIERPEWGADVRDRDLGDKAIAFLSALDGSWGEVTSHVAAQQARLWSITCANLRAIARAVGWQVAETIFLSNDVAS